MSTKSLSYLIEAALEKEAVLMASAAITEKLERISKELAKMIADDVIPLGDSMRDLFGADQATSFENLISEKINGLLEQVRTARNEISDQIDALKSGEPMNDMAKAGDDMFGQDDGGAPAPQGDDMAGAPAPEGDDPFGMGGDDQGDDDSAFGGQAADPGFGGNEAGAMGGAAGRPQKESAAPRRAKLDELSNATKKAYAGKAQDQRADAMQTTNDKGYVKAKHPDNMTADEKKLSAKRARGLDMVRKKVAESTDARLSKQFKTLLTKGHSVDAVLNHLSESYGMHRSDVAQIVLNNGK